MNKISKFAQIYGNVTFGDNVRIDDFCILTGDIRIGNNVHIACFSFLSGGAGIEIDNFVQIAPRCCILTGSDDYSGLSLVGPCIPDEYKPGLVKGQVIIGRHALFGANTVIMPGVTVGEGAVTGAFSFVRDDLEPWTMYRGIPVKAFGARSQEMLKLESSFMRGEV